MGLLLHCSAKLSGSKRWKAVKDTLNKESGIQVHFSDPHDNYWSAFKYITKSDPNIYRSSSHPNMQEMSFLKAKVCVQAVRQKHKSRSTDTSGDQVSTTTKSPKIARLSNLTSLATKSAMKTNCFLLHIHKKKRAKKTLPTFCCHVCKNHWVTCLPPQNDQRLLLKKSRELIWAGWTW